MADVSTATVIGTTTWVQFNRMTTGQRTRFLYEYQKLGGVIDSATLPASAGLVAVGGKFKTHLEANSRGNRGGES
jgi:hypothetical protein